MTVGAVSRVELDGVRLAAEFFRQRAHALAAPKPLLAPVMKTIMERED